MTHTRGSENGNRWSPTGVEVLTRSGEMISLLSPDTHKIKLADIAAHLAAQVRFSGACPLMPTIAQHSLAVEYIADRLAHEREGANATQSDYRSLSRAALMHDAAEYLVGDNIGAVKKLMRAESYRRVFISDQARYDWVNDSVFDRLEDRVQAAIVARFDCADTGWEDIIHEADCIACAFEMAWGEWCPAAQPPAWALEGGRLVRCYRPRIADDMHDGGESAFIARAAQLGMTDLPLCRECRAAGHACDDSCLR